MAEIIHGCHLVGSVPLPNTEAVFRQCLAAAPGRLKRIPDGETGDRQGFTTWQAGVFGAYPAMLTEFVHNAPINNKPFTPEQVDEGIEAIKKAGIKTGYDDVAIESYTTFKNLREEGVIPQGVKFQVCLPTVTNVITPFIQRAFQPKVEPIYEAALFAAIHKIQDIIPHSDLSFQMDNAADTAFWEATNPETLKANSGLEWFQPWWEGDVKQYQTDFLVRWLAQIDQDVEVGWHNCYGDMQHRHWHEPQSLAVVAERAKMVWAKTTHKINFFHCPVPKSAEQHIDEYLAPLKELIPLFEEHGTEVYLGLVHEHHLDLTKKYIEAVRRVLPELKFGVAAECGGGRMQWPDFENMLQISSEVSAKVVGEGPVEVVKVENEDAKVGAESAEVKADSKHDSVQW